MISIALYLYAWIFWIFLFLGMFDLHQIKSTHVGCDFHSKYPTKICVSLLYFVFLPVHSHALRTSYTKNQNYGEG